MSIGVLHKNMRKNYKKHEDKTIVFRLWKYGKETEYDFPVTPSGKAERRTRDAGSQPSRHASTHRRKLNGIKDAPQVPEKGNITEPAQLLRVELLSDQFICQNTPTVASVVQFKDRFSAFCAERAFWKTLSIRIHRIKAKSLKISPQSHSCFSPAQE